MQRLALLVAPVACVLALAGASTGAAAGQAQATTPIAHIVVLMQENHSFDSELGYWCDQNPSRCTGMPGSVTLADGTVVTPGTTPDTVPQVNHSVQSQGLALANNWDQIAGCQAATGYACISGYQPSAIPNLATLASTYTILDHAFTLANAPSWGGHLDELAGTTDGFTGDNPSPVKGYKGKVGPGWGCNATGKVAAMLPVNGVKIAPQPSCVPDFSLGLANGGAWEPTKAAHVATIMDEMDTAGVTWKIYAGGNGNAWSGCPSFADCLYTAQDKSLVPDSQFSTDAAAGTLPQVSFVMPAGANGGVYSQHNGQSNAAGDNWIGQVAQAAMTGPEGGSTALVITWDDCGCFYDQVAPPPAPDGRQMGPRVPFVIVSPYAKQGFTDTGVTSSTGSILAFIEADFGLPALGANDAQADNLMGDFTFTPGAARLRLPRMTLRHLPPSAYKLAWSTAHDAT